MNRDVHRLPISRTPRPFSRFAALPVRLGVAALVLSTSLAAQEPDAPTPEARTPEARTPEARTPEAHSGMDPQTMTVEELESYIAEQKKALELVRENRDITAEKARELREAQAEKEAERRAQMRALEALCRERETIEPGTLDECLESLEKHSGEMDEEATDSSSES